MHSLGCLSVGAKPIDQQMFYVTAVHQCEVKPATHAFEHMHQAKRITNTARASQAGRNLSVVNQQTMHMCQPPWMRRHGSEGMCLPAAHLHSALPAT